MGRANRLVQAGTAVTGLGGTVTAVALGYALTNDLSLWNLPFLAATSLTVIGLLLLAIALVPPGEKEQSGAPSMSQSSGKNSTNIQAGRDISLNGSDDGEN